MIKFSSYQGNANKKNNEVQPNSTENDLHTEIKK